MGRVSFADSVTQYFIICASLGIPIYGVREVAKIKENKKALSKLFSELMLITLNCYIFANCGLLGADFASKRILYR